MATLQPVHSSLPQCDDEVTTQSVSPQLLPAESPPFNKISRTSFYNEGKSPIENFSHKPSLVKNSFSYHGSPASFGLKVSGTDASTSVALPLYAALLRCPPPPPSSHLSAITLEWKLEKQAKQTKLRLMREARQQRAKDRQARQVDCNNPFVKVVQVVYYYPAPWEALI